jgi:hypothetical protein
MLRPGIALAVLSTGCFTLHPYETVEKIPLRSNPPGALITMTDDSGSKAIGTAPLDAEVTVVHDRYEFNPVASWLMTASSLALLGVSLFFAIDPPDETTFDGTMRDHQLARVFGISGSTIFGITSLIMVPVTIMGHVSDGEDASVRYKNGLPTFEAELAGHTSATIRPSLEAIPPAEPLALDLTQQEMLGGLIASAPIENTRPVLAVFDLDPGNSGVAQEIAVQLSDYLTAKIASVGRYRVVPRSELRQRLSGEKKTSYRDCFDETCQIELGKAVAAEKTLAAKLIRVGDTCALTATVFDLKSEATDAAQTVRTGCGQDGLMDAVDTVADRLANGS